MEEKIYCGNGKVHNFNEGSVLNIMLDMTTLEKYFQEHGFTSNAGNKKIKIKVQARKEVDQYGNSHSVLIDQWKPTQQGSPNDSKEFQSDVPF